MCVCASVAGLASCSLTEGAGGSARDLFPLNALQQFWGWINKARVPLSCKAAINQNFHFRRFPTQATQNTWLDDSFIVLLHFLRIKIMDLAAFILGIRFFFLFYGSRTLHLPISTKLAGCTLPLPLNGNPVTQYRRKPNVRIERMSERNSDPSTV